MFFNFITKILNPDSITRFLFNKKQAVVLLYHNPSYKHFESHLKYLSKYYQFISLDTLVNAIYEKNWNNIPKNACVIVFDDGHKNNFQLLSLFKQYQVKPTIYLCSKILNNYRQFWFNVVRDNKTREDLKKMPNYKRLEILERNYNFDQTHEYEDIPQQALNLDEINLMKTIVDFENHSAYHPILTSLNDKELEHELTSSKSDLENLGIRTKHFAYPNGDYTSREINELKKLGYQSAHTTNNGFVKQSANPFELNVLGISDNADICKLKWQLSGIYGIITNFILYKNIRGIKQCKLNYE